MKVRENVNELEHNQERGSIKLNVGSQTGLINSRYSDQKKTGRNTNN